MPTGWDDSVDSAQVYDASSSFVGGQFSYAKPRELQSTQASLIQDCEVAVTGQWSSRFGTALLGGSVGGGAKIEALSFFNAPGFVYEVAISGTVSSNFLKLNGASWTNLGNIAVSDTPSITQGVNKLLIAAGGDVLSWDGTSLVNISGDTGNTNMTGKAPRGVSMLVWHTNRLIAAGPNIKSFSTDTVAVPDAIYLSDLLAPTDWGPGNAKNQTQIRIGAGDGLGITSLVPWTGFNLAVFKRHSVWVVDADPTLTPDQMDVQSVHTSVGCIARRSAVQVGSDILFLADDGVRSLTQVIGSDQQHELSVPLSYPIQDVINRINWAAASSAAAIFWRNLYLLAIPIDGSTTNNFILVFNTVEKSWQGSWTNLPIHCFSMRESSSITRLMMGLSTINKVIEYLDYTNPSSWLDSTFEDYGGATVVPRVIYRGFTFGDSLSPKLGLGGEIEWNNSKGSLSIVPIVDEVRLDVKSIPVIIDSGGFTIPFMVPLSIPPNGLGHKQFDLMQFGEFRDLQFDIRGVGVGRKEVRQLALGAIVRPTLVGTS